MKDDHISASWQEAFEHLEDNVGNVLEFGLGPGTRFLVERAKHVTSVELYCHHDQQGWFGWVTDHLQSTGKWKGYLYECSDEYLPEVEEYIMKRLGDKKWDVILVDPGCHFRGKILQQCFGYAPAIIAHDTNRKAYGYDDVETPEDYKVVFRGGGEGTTLWIKDEQR